MRAIGKCSVGPAQLNTPEHSHRTQEAVSAVLRHTGFSRIFGSMEVHFTPEQEAQLAQIATRSGTGAEQLVTNVVARYLDEQARFIAAVQKGLEAAERGEFIEEEEMDARFEAMLKD
jgi:predicted transcriptional regulator